MINEKMNKFELLLFSGLGIGIIYITFFLVKRRYGKSISFSNKNQINYIPTNQEMNEYKNDLYYSIDDLKEFSYKAKYNPDYETDYEVEIIGNSYHPYN